MVSELCIEYALFLDDYNLLRSINQTELSSTNEIDIMFEKYVAEGALMQLNLSGPQREQLKLKIQNENCDVSVFNTVKDEVDMLIFRNTFSRFVKKRNPGYYFPAAV